MTKIHAIRTGLVQVRRPQMESRGRGAGGWADSNDEAELTSRGLDRLDSGHVTCIDCLRNRSGIAQDCRYVPVDGCEE
jgi:hypothetical protein